MLVITILGALVGLVLGLTGAGGGILAVPALVLGMQWPMTQAAPIALIAVGLAAVTGALDGLQKRQVRYKAAILMAIAGALTAPIGIALAHQLSDTLLMFCFGALMVLIATRMLRGLLGARQAAQKSQMSKPCRLNTGTGKFIWTPPTILTIGGIGAVTGMFTGLLGVGGGFLVVPALQRYTPLSLHSIVATSLMVIAMVSGSAVTVALWQNRALPSGSWYFVCAVISGMILGRLLAPRLPARTIQLTFALLCLVAAGIVLLQAAGLIGPLTQL
ncbi:MAG TPA: sulfite exporter TauE/SafE family protein [Paenalcaligenes sp.]|nr:sulfite exporter TauE/SafE family protein [Paenalcaligenes sp.]